MVKSSVMGYGNIISYNNSIVFTSTEVAGSAMKILCSLLEAVLTDMNKLTNIPMEILVQDYICETGNDIMHESMKAASGVELPIYTRTVINKLLDKKEEI